MAGDSRKRNKATAFVFRKCPETRHSQKLRLKVAVAACLLIAVLIGLPLAQASPDVEARIISALGWLKGQEISDSNLTGFARGTDAATNRTIFVEDQALLALALSDYHSTHNDDTYDSLLKVAANFIMSARTSSGDFYEYYDLRSQQWFHAGALYPWDAYAIAGLAAAAYKISSKSTKDQSFWTTIEAKLKQSLNNSLSNQRDDGAWLFRNYASRTGEALTRENALYLVGLQYVALFEHQWGSNQQAGFYARLSERTASWLFSKQSSNVATFGGFPHSDLNSTQISEENGAVLLGVDTYYSIIGVLVPQPSPTIWDARRVMADWVSGFARKMRDQYGGPYYGRDSTGMMEYPKTTLAAVWMLQALVDIWINLGGFEYYADSQRPYDWIVGGNELRADLQGATSVSGVPGGFYRSVTDGTLDKTARMDVTASAVYGFVRAAFILVQEFPAGVGMTLLFMGLCAVLTVKRRRARKLVRCET